MSAHLDANDDADGITRFVFKPETLYGKEVTYKEFNKMEAYIIRIRKSYDAEASKNVLIHMLETLLSIKKKEEVKNILQKEHGMIMEINDTEEVGKMCNFGEALYEEALEKGIEQGVEKGIESKLIYQISKKLKKGKDIPTIADEIEETEEYVLELMERYKLTV